MDKTFAQTAVARYDRVQCKDSCLYYRPEATMSAIAAVPIIIEPEASARVAELGMQKKSEVMLEHPRQAIPGPLQVNATFEPPYDTGDEPRVVTEALRGGPFHVDDPTRAQWITWAIENFPPDVLRHFTTLILYGIPDAR